MLLVSFNSLDQPYKKEVHYGELPHLVSISDLRQDAAKILKLVQASKEPLIITQRGRATVMQSLETFERSERQKELLCLLIKGEKEIAAGQGYELDAVLAASRYPSHPLAPQPQSGYFLSGFTQCPPR